MSTKITVAVGPNGEALNSKALRDGSRADRIETEATTKQAKQFVAEEVDKLTQGRDNPDSKYKPSRDPAAFARKKKEEEVTPGQFCGLKIEFEHFPLSGLWSQKRNASYMNIRVNGITSQGDMPPEITKIELKRNLVTDTFNAPTPLGYVPESIFTSGYTPGNGPWGFCNWPVGLGNGTGVLDIQLGNTYYGLENFSEYAILNGGQINDDLTFSPTAYNDGDNFQPITPRCMGAIGASTSYTMYAEVFGPRQFSWQPPPEGYPPLADNPNTYANGRTDDDDMTEQYVNYHQDPVHELFMLPFTGDKCFLLVIYTDYMIQTRSFSKQVSTVTTAPAFNYVVDPQTNPKSMTTNVIDYKRYEPDYNLPEGYEIEGLGFPGDPIAENQCKAKVTEAGANKIQTIKLYSIDNGVITEVEEIPQQLREAAASLSANLEGFVVNSYVARNYNASTYRVTAVYDGGTSDFDAQTTDGDDTISFPYLFTNTNFIGNSTINSHVQTSRKYYWSQTRERSLPKGYGFGQLSTNNHFRSKYINKLSKGFSDDLYFTPAVYDYLRGTGNGPTTVYGDEAGSGLAGDLNLYADEWAGRVRFTTVRPSTISTKHPGPFEPWQEIPALKGATHQCWNWNRPDICWDQLNALGFERDLIGSRPARPNE